MRTTRRSARALATIAVSAVLLIAPAPAIAGSGVAELTLDRAGVSAMLSASLPHDETLRLAGMGDVRLTIEAVDGLHFQEGEVRARVTATFRSDALESAVVSGKIDVRYAPAIERMSGTAQLVALSARPVAPLRLDVDLARWLPPIDLPRRMNWTLPLREGATVDLALFVQGLEVDDERLRVDLGVVARPGIGDSPRR